MRGNMIVKASKIKLQDMKFRKYINKMLDDELGASNYMFVDLSVNNENSGIYVNSIDRVTIMLRNRPTIETLLGLSVVGVWSNADELNWFKTKDREYVITLWWD